MISAWVHDPWQDTWRLFTNVGSPHLLVSDVRPQRILVSDANRLPRAPSPEQRVLGLHTIGPVIAEAAADG
jgi:hypothetical protein